MNKLRFMQFYYPYRFITSLLDDKWFTLDVEYNLRHGVLLFLFCFDCFAWHNYGLWTKFPYLLFKKFAN